MKEIHTSFLLSTKSNQHRENSILENRFGRTFIGFVQSSLLVYILLSVFSISGAAQSSSVDPIQAQITTDAYSHNDWKSLAEYTVVINSEKTSTAQTLSNPNLTTQQFALYSGYDKLLTYIQLDLSKNEILADIAPKNFKRVKIEAPGDPILHNMKIEQFNALYQSLNEKLHY